MSVAPVLMHFFWILIFTTAAMQIRLAARISKFIRFLPIGRMIISATIQIPVTIRNIRSRKAILWLKMISNHFFIT